MQKPPSTPLARILDAEGRKQSWLARQTSIAPSRLNHIVHGLHATQNEAQAIADALGRSIDELFPDTRAAA